MVKKQQYRCYPQKILILITLLVGITVWIISIYHKLNIADYYGSVSVRYDDAILTEQKIQDTLDALISSQEINVPEVTLWQKTDHVEVKNQYLSTNSKVDIITVAGDMSRVYPERILWGGYIFEEDYTGCVIDRKTAYDLFHTENAVGMPIKYNNKEYVIRGIIDITEYCTMLIQTNDMGVEKNNIQFSCMELKFTNNENAVSLAESFVLSHDLGSPSAYINGYMYQKMADRIVLFPAWFFALWIMYQCIRKVYTFRGSLVLFLISGIFVFLLSILLVKMVDLHIYYPVSLIPNKWSNFDFWINKWKIMRESAGERESIMQYYKDIKLRKSFFYVVSGSAITVITEVIILNSCRIGWFIKDRSND